MKKTIAKIIILFLLIISFYNYIVNATEISIGNADEDEIEYLREDYFYPTYIYKMSSIWHGKYPIQECNDNKNGCYDILLLRNYFQIIETDVEESQKLFKDIQDYNNTSSDYKNKLNKYMEELDIKSLKINMNFCLKEYKIQKEKNLDSKETEEALENYTNAVQKYNQAMEKYNKQVKIYSDETRQKYDIISKKKEDFLKKYTYDMKKWIKKEENQSSYCYDTKDKDTYIILWSTFDYKYYDYVMLNLKENLIYDAKEWNTVALNTISENKDNTNNSNSTNNTVNKTYPKIKLDIIDEDNSKKIKVTINSANALSYVSYAWNLSNAKEVELPKNKNEFSFVIDVLKGTNYLTITAIDSQGNKTSEIREYTGLTRPYITVTLSADGSELIVNAQHENGIKKIYYTLNDIPYEKIFEGDDIKQEVEFVQQLDEGYNKFTIAVTSIDETKTVFDGECTYNSNEKGELKENPVQQEEPDTLVQASNSNHSTDNTVAKGILPNTGKKILIPIFIVLGIVIAYSAYNKYLYLKGI